MSEIAIAALTAKKRLSDDAPADKPKRKPIPDHIPRVEVELTTSDTACAQCGGKLRRLGEVEKDQQMVRGTVCPATDRGTGIRARKVHREPPGARSRAEA